MAGVESVIPPSCFGFADGSLVIAASEGTYPYQYDFGDGLQSDSTLTGLSAGTYSVYVVDDVGCDQDFELTITDPAPLGLTAEGIDASCDGTDDGQGIARTTGGTPAYSYVWEDGQTDTLATNLAPGDYAVTVTDANGCTNTASIVVAEPSPVILTLLEETDVLCFGDETGEISVTATGGLAPFTYVIPGRTPMTDTIFTGLGANTYDLIAIDANGCTDTIQGTVGQPNPILVDAGPDEEIKLGFGTGLQGTATGDGDTLSYLWTPPDSLSCLICTDPFASPTRTTDYVLTVIDEDGCVGVDSVNVRVIIERPVFIPTAFSPNNDGNNDRFVIFGNEAIRNIRTFRVFSRWGNLVYEGVNLDPGLNSAFWDGIFKGELMQSQVLAYYAEIEFVDGVMLVYEGDVTLMR